MVPLRFLRRSLFSSYSYSPSRSFTLSTYSLPLPSLLPPRRLCHRRHLCPHCHRCSCLRRGRRLDRCCPRRRLHVLRPLCHFLLPSLRLLLPPKILLLLPYRRPRPLPLRRTTPPPRSPSCRRRVPTTAAAATNAALRAARVYSVSYVAFSSSSSLTIPPTLLTSTSSLPWPSFVPASGNTNRQGRSLRCSSCTNCPLFALLSLSSSLLLHVSRAYFARQAYRRDGHTIHWIFL